MTYLNAISHSITDTDEEVCDETEALGRTSTPKHTCRSEKRKEVVKHSFIWNHVHKLVDLKVTRCNYCKQSWNKLRGSTSNARFHLRTKQNYSKATVPGFSNIHFFHDMHFLKNSFDIFFKGLAILRCARLATPRARLATPFQRYLAEKLV